MTDAKYKHLGKAIEAAVILAKKVEGLRGEAFDLQTELHYLVGGEDAREIVKAILTDCLPLYRIGEAVAGIVEAAWKEESNGND